MKINYKIKGNVAGYIAVVLLFIIVALNFYIIAYDIHFKYDVFVMLMLASIFEGCRDTYKDFRKKEIDEIIMQQKDGSGNE